ncbi:NUDIX domain-containing protein [Dietzia sp. PP-33]|uniref:NUDIX hydrolase n=1 Tax=Dietzia sp. PP-33 TaxID=2957500 RepID=UPI0029B289D6|nr:NUDIX domain-containing protein [Dietzia sp. PP-33]MDX2357862.1 NUDIX domain-containing protein [Dietzia sp. PP-33]
MDNSDRGHGRVISVSAVVLTRADGAVVTVRKAGTDRFMLPGGKWEAGETPLQCAVREIGEELGVTIAPEGLTPVGRFTTATANEPGFRLVSEVFAAQTGGRVEALAEIAETRWVSAAEWRAVAALPEDDCAPWAPLLVRVAREGLPRHRAGRGGGGEPPDGQVRPRGSR